jgi:hypothetical protein
MHDFRSDVLAKWELEDQYAKWEHPTNPRYLGERPSVSDDQTYKEVRARIANHTNRAEALARRHHVGHSMSIILRDGSGGPSPGRSGMLDGVDRTVGAIEEVLEAERHRVWNPLWWLLHGPFMLLRSAGVNTEGVERRLWSRVAVQLGVDVAVGLLAALIVYEIGVGR